MICNSYTSYCDRMQNKLQNVRPEKQKNGISYFVTVALLSVLKLTIYDVFIVWLFLCHFRFKQNKKQKDCVSLTLHSMSKIVTVFSCKPSNNERYFTCWKVCYTGRENRHVTVTMMKVNDSVTWPGLTPMLVVAKAHAARYLLFIFSVMSLYRCDMR